MSAPLAAVASTLASRLQKVFPDTLSRLTDLVRIPSCSFPGYDPQHLQHSGAAVAAWLRAIGVPEVRLIDGYGKAPHILAHDRRAGPGAPTLLLYAHHDVQPPLRDSLWTSPAFEPVIRDGRLFGRGAADDKAGIAAITSAYQACTAEGPAPVNITFLIEGEEEIGSPHLARFVEAHLEDLRADGLLIADLVNVQTGVPSLTVSLRGLLALEIELRTLQRPLHSGLWGGRMPDPVLILSRLLAGLADDQGGLTIAGLSIPEPPAQAVADLRLVPFDAADFARQAGLPPAAVGLLGDAEVLYTDTWYRPHLSINAIHAGGEPGAAGNVIMDSAWARISIRLTAGMDAAELSGAIHRQLRAGLPPGAELRLQTEATAPAWAMDPAHPLLERARQAFAAGYEHPAVTIGCGASIPFVETLTGRLGDIPAILVPVEDPQSNAHAENESVHLGDLEKTARSLAILLATCQDL